jgi:IS4 transposase
MIFRTWLPGVHTFLRPAQLPARSAGFVCRLVLTFCCHLGRMSATQAATLPRCEPRHPAAIGRFLGRQRWAKGDWMKPLRGALLRRETVSEGVFFFLLDQTVSSRQGSQTPNTFSTGNRTRRPCQGRRYQTKKSAPKRCHAFVLGLLLTPSGLRLPYRRSYYTHDYCQSKGLTHRTQAELGAELIRDLELPDHARVVVLGDTAYEAASVQRACAARGWSWLTPCNSERVLAGAKPRPKVRTLLAEASAQRFTAVKVHPDTDPYARQRRWSASARDRRNPGRTYWVWRKQGVVHSVGVVQVFVSTTKKPHAGQPLHEPKILLSNDLKLTAREAVRRYTLRWQIELFFKECKSVLGMVQYRFADFERVERWVDLALTTYLYLEWYRWGRLERPKLSGKEREHWASQRTAGLCRAVRAERDDGELQWLEKRLATTAGSQRLRRLLQTGLRMSPPRRRRARTGKMNNPATQIA